MKRRIHLGFHFYGAGNAGDDLMIKGFLQELKRASIDAHVTCCTPFDVESQRSRFPEINWLSYDHDTRRNAVRDCDIWLGLGGAAFQSDSGGWLFEHMRVELALLDEFDRPAYMLCVGVNNPEAVEGAEAKVLLNAMRFVWTRDTAGAYSLAELSGWSRIQPAADLAHLCFETPRAHRPSPSGLEPLILVIHSENPEHVDPAVLNKLILSYSGPVYWYCQEVRDFECTEIMTYGRLSDEARAKLILFHPDYHTGSLDELISVFERGGVCLTSRYHSAILSAWMGLRVAVFARNAKLDGVIDQLRLTRVRSLTAFADIREALDAAMPVDADLLQGLRHRASFACQSFFRLTEF